MDALEDDETTEELDAAMDLPHDAPELPDSESANANAEMEDADDSLDNTPRNDADGASAAVNL